MLNISSFDEVCNILLLLPYSDNGELNSKHRKLETLYFIKSIIEFSIITLEIFLLNNLEAFDAQVGENLCQIRAYKILHLAKKLISTPEAMESSLNEVNQIKSYKHKLDTVIYNWENKIKASTCFDRELDCQETIAHFLDKNELLFNLPEDFLFIIACGFLTHFNVRDDDKIPIAINLRKISSELGISKYRAKRLTHKYQQLVCSLGCNFILAIAQELPEEFGYNEFFPELYKISDEDRAVLPCFFVSEVIFYHSIQEKIPVLLVVRRIQKASQKITDVLYFLLKGRKQYLDYMVIDSQKYLQENCLIVSGDMQFDEDSISTSIDRVFTETPLKLILSNTASHPQYSGERLALLRDNPFALKKADEMSVTTLKQLTKLKDMRRYAAMTGCCKENQNVFFLKHIYASRLCQMLNQLQANYGGILYEALALNADATVYSGDIHAF